MGVTRDDLLGMLARVNAAAESVGFLNGEELVLQESGPGRPYRLYQRKPPATGLRDPLNGSLQSYLGFTKPEAYGTLHTIASTLEAVRRLNDDH